MASGFWIITASKWNLPSATEIIFYYDILGEVHPRTSPVVLGFDYGTIISVYPYSSKAYFAIFIL